MYQETPFVNPYVGSIADLITRPADARAAAIRAAGEAQARAAEISGQAYGGALAGAGQAIGGAIQQQNNPERILAQQQVDANKRNLAYGSAVNAILSKAKGPDGKYDHDFLTAQMSGANIPQGMQADVLKTVDSLEDHGKKMQDARLEGQADVGHLIFQTIKALPKDADPNTINGAVLHAAALAKGSGVADDAEIQHVLGAIDDGTPAMGVALGLMGQSPSKRYDDLLKPLVIPRAGASVQDASGNVSTPVPERPPQPTEASLAAAAHPSDPAGALAALKPQPPAAKTEWDANVDAALAKYGKKTWQELTPQQMQDTITAFRTPVRNPDAVAATDQAHSDAKAAKDAQTQTQSYQFHTEQLKPIAAPIATKNDEIANLYTLLNQHNPQADADVAPKLLSLFAGGPGTGLRMNQATIDRNAGGHTAWVGLEQTLNKFSTDPTHASIPEAQRQQIYQLLGVAQGQVSNKLGAIQDYQKVLADPNSTVQEHRQGFADLQAKLTKLESDSTSGHAPSGNMRNAAAVILHANGKASDEAAIDTFLKNNPTWKP